jgi:imidazolonepropionase-like amidohydrolase
MRPDRLGLALLALIAGCAPKHKDRIALVGGSVISGAGSTVLRDAVLVIYQGKIETVSPREGFRIPRTAEVVDITGSWVIPGLIDVHAHTARWALPRYIAAGVTTVRDLHGTSDSILALREEVSLGGMVAPRIYAAGAMIDGDPPTYDNATIVRNAADARRAIDARAVAGIDVVKLYTRITPELLKPLMDEAATFNLKVAAHLGMTDAVTAARLGVTEIEHMTGVPEAASGNPAPFYAQHKASFFQGWNYFERSWATLDSAALARVAVTLAQANVAITPTLVLHDTYSRLDDPAVLTNPDLKSVPDSEIRRWNLPDLKARAAWDDKAMVAFRASRPKQDQFLRDFRAAGGRIGVGTDASNQMIVPGWSVHTEMELLVRAGLTPDDAIRAATRGNATLIGADSIGIIAPGKVADLVVLASDPRADIRNTRTIKRVMVRGQLFNGDSLRVAP